MTAKTFAEALEDFQRDLFRLGLGELEGIAFKQFGDAENAMVSVASTGAPTFVPRTTNPIAGVVALFLHARFRGVAILSPPDHVIAPQFR